MKIKGFGIKNFRSFDEAGVTLDSLNKINVIIGKNNCGKSNVLRFLQTLNSNIKDLNKFPNDIQNQHRRNGQQSVLQLLIKGDDLPVDKNRMNDNRFFDYQNFLNEIHAFDFSINSQSIQLPEFLSKLDQNQLMPFSKTISSC